MCVHASVGYDKMYHDTDTDTFSEKYRDTDNIYFQSILILDTFVDTF